MRGRAGAVRGGTAFVLLLLLLCAACGSAGSATTIVLASTTSVYDSGLLDELIPAFEREHAPLRVRVVAVGSGQALALGRRGDADVLLVHSPADETRYMEGGHGRRRLTVMSNDFVLAGPQADAAAVRGLEIGAALRRIAERRARFISRGDSSGTHQRELQLWRDAGVSEAELAFRSEVGQGMGETLAIASERAAYTLTDRASWLALSATLRSVILVEGGPGLTNVYSVITVAGARNEAGADAFADWVVSPHGAAAIDRFGRNEYGRPLFEPAR